MGQRGLVMTVTGSSPFRVLPYHISSNPFSRKVFHSLDIRKAPKSAENCFSYSGLSFSRVMNVECCREDLLSTAFNHTPNSPVVDSVYVPVLE